jgi:hypothetical protein
MTPSPADPPAPRRLGRWIAAAAAALLALAGVAAYFSFFRSSEPDNRVVDYVFYHSTSGFWRPAIVIDLTDEVLWMVPALYATSEPLPDRYDLPDGATEGESSSISPWVIEPIRERLAAAEIPRWHASTDITGTDGTSWTVIVGYTDGSRVEQHGYMDWPDQWDAFKGALDLLAIVP